MESFSDPETLLTREDVTVDEVDFEVGEAEFEAMLEDWDSHAVVGITTGEGEVLLMNDGSHGWTLTAFAVEAGEDWVAAGRRRVENLTGVAVDIDRPERIRQYNVRIEDETDRQTTIHDVIFRASPVADACVAAEMVTGIDDDIQDIGWFEELPDDVDADDSDPVDDIRLFLD